MMFFVFMRLLYDEAEGVIELPDGFSQFTLWEVFSHPRALEAMQTILGTPQSCVRLLGWVTCIFLKHFLAHFFLMPSHCMNIDEHVP
jgi:hypothetical protein